MADYLDLINTTVSVENKQIVESLNAPSPLIEKVKVFFPEEIYNVTESSLLYKFLLALLGDAGVGGMKKAFLYPRLQNALTSTQFNDLDTLFTNPFAFPRLSDEIYTSDPGNELLTSEEWAKIRRKDAWYKSRFLDYMQGIQAGLTEEGVKLLAKSATGAPAEVYERWKYLDDIVSDDRVGFPNIGNTNSRNEIVVQVENDSYSVKDNKRLTGVFGRVAPSNMAMTYRQASTNLTEIPIKRIEASSEFFYVKRLVTGNTFQEFPDVSTKYNTWIESGVQKQAPIMALNEVQESITYPTIFAASASSTHIGPFNQNQKDLFAHLQSPPSSIFRFDANQSYLTSPVNLEISTPWYSRGGNNSLIVNNYYPLGYFADNNPNDNLSSKVFWASDEDAPGVSEYVEFDLQSTRPINMVEFEICMKPINISLEYLDSNEEWQPVILRTDVENHDKVFYSNSASYSWQNVEISFEDIQTSKMKATFERRPDGFPFETSVIFDWSIEVRNLRFAYIMSDKSSFVADSGTDVLGNSYQTELATYSVDSAVDGDIDTFWQCQANPSKDAVEALYFDISSSENPSTIDEIWVDPVTPGALVHIYYSDDDNVATVTKATPGSGDLVVKDDFLYDDGILRGNGYWSTLSPWGIKNQSLEVESNLLHSVDAGSSPEKNALLDKKFQDGDYVIELGPINEKTLNTYFNWCFTQSQYEVYDGANYVSTYGINISIDPDSTSSVDTYKAVNNTFTLSNTFNLPAVINRGDKIIVRQDSGTATIYFYSVSLDELTTVGSFTDTDPLPEGGIVYGSTDQEFYINSIQFRSFYTRSVSDWDYKLWTPVPRHYTLQRGNIKLPNPITAKFIKIEFTKFTPSPYPALYRDNLPPVRYRSYPTWVLEYIGSVDQANSIKKLKDIINNQVIIDNKNLGITNPDITKLSEETRKSLVDFINNQTTSTVLSNYETWKPGVATQSNVDTQDPKVYPNTLFAQSLLSTVTNFTVQGENFINRNVSSGSSFRQERSIEPRPLLPIVSKSDRSLVELEKTRSDFWFPKICRHGYKVIETKRDFKVAYYVSIREVKFYRRNQTSAFDDRVYFETLADVSNTESNTFVQGDWRYIVPASVVEVAGTNVIPTYGWENFDGITFLTSG